MMVTSPSLPNFFRYFSWKARSKSWTEPREDGDSLLRSESLINSTWSIPCTVSRITTFFSSIKGRSSLGLTKINSKSGFSGDNFFAAIIALLSKGSSMLPNT